MIRNALSVALIAMFVAGCSNTPSHVASANAPYPESTNSVSSDGPAAPQEKVGQAGPQDMDKSTGALGSSVPSWNYTFGGDSEAIRNSDSGKSQEIANYMNQNPSSTITISGPSPRYDKSVVNVLTAAGVPANKIQIGGLTDPTLRNDHRVDVMIGN